MSKEVAKTGGPLRHVVGYASAISAAMLGLLTLASLGQQTPSYLASAVLLLATVALLAVSWYALLEERTHHTEEAPGE